MSHQSANEFSCHQCIFMTLSSALCHLLQDIIIYLVNVNKQQTTTSFPTTQTTFQTMQHQEQYPSLPAKGYTMSGADSAS